MTQPTVRVLVACGQCAVCSVPHNVAIICYGQRVELSWLTWPTTASATSALNSNSLRVVQPLDATRLDSSWFFFCCCFQTANATRNCFIKRKTRPGSSQLVKRGRHRVRGLCEWGEWGGTSRVWALKTGAHARARIFWFYVNVLRIATWLLGQHFSILIIVYMSAISCMYIVCKVSCRWGPSLSRLQGGTMEGLNWTAGDR